MSKKIILVVILVLIIAVGAFVISQMPTAKEKVYASLENLDSASYYWLYTLYNQQQGGETLKSIDIDYTIDENNNMAERHINYVDTPDMKEILKYNENSITRYYGYYLEHEEYENTYYLDKWRKQEISKTSAEYEKYEFLNKDFYVEMLKNGKEYSRADGKYSVLVGKEYIQQMIDKLDLKEVKILTDVYVEVTVDNNNISFLNIWLDSSNSNITEGHAVLSPGFDAECDGHEEKYLEAPEIFEEVEE